MICQIFGLSLQYYLKPIRMKNKFIIGKEYCTKIGNDIILITDIVEDSPFFEYRVYYTSETLKGGLIDNKGQYFMINSVFADGLSVN